MNLLNSQQQQSGVQTSMPQNPVSIQTSNPTQTSTANQPITSQAQVIIIFKLI